MSLRLLRTNVTNEIRICGLSAGGDVGSTDGEQGGGTLNALITRTGQTDTTGQKAPELISIAAVPEVGLRATEELVK